METISEMINNKAVITDLVHTYNDLDFILEHLYFEYLNIDEKLNMSDKNKKIYKEYSELRVKYPEIVDFIMTDYNQNKIKVSAFISGMLYFYNQINKEKNLYYKYKNSRLLNVLTQL